MWLDEKHKAFKLHTHFELLKGIPVGMTLTDANASEWKTLAASLLADRVYVSDRGYACFELMSFDPPGPQQLCRAPCETTASTKPSNRAR